jgi:hypothetical protein
MTNISQEFVINPSHNFFLLDHTTVLQYSSRNKMKNTLLMTLSAIIMASNFATVLGNDKSNPNTIITSQSQHLRRAQNKAGKNEVKAGKSTTAKAGKQSSSPTQKPTAIAVSLTKSPTRKPTTLKPATGAPTNSPNTAKAGKNEAKADKQRAGKNEAKAGKSTAKAGKQSSSPTQSPLVPLLLLFSMDNDLTT